MLNYNVRNIQLRFLDNIEREGKKNKAYKLLMLILPSIYFYSVLIDDNVSILNFFIITTILFAISYGFVRLLLVIKKKLINASFLRAMNRIIASYSNHRDPNRYLQEMLSIESRVYDLECIDTWKLNVAEGLLHVDKKAAHLVAESIDTVKSKFISWQTRVVKEAIRVEI